jgi:hypothetical protein
MTGPGPAAVRPAEISALLQWCGRLLRAGAAAYPAEVAAYQAAKTSLLETIARQHAGDDPDLAARARQAAARARNTHSHARKETT